MRILKLKVRKEAYRDATLEIPAEVQTPEEINDYIVEHGHEFKWSEEDTFKDVWYFVEPLGVEEV